MRDTLRIGGATVVPGLNAISSASGVAPVRPKSMDVLVYLANRPGQVVSRDEILTAVWGDVAVSPDTLTQAIVELRKAFGDSVSMPRVIQTIPRRGYRLLPPVAREGTTEPDPPIRSIAVLPLRNFSGRRRARFFADGVTEEIISELARIGDLRVISHQSVARYRDTAMSIPEITRALNVEAVVRGSMLAEADRIRIHVQLVRPNPERHVWAEVFDAERSHLLALQRSVARAVARRLGLPVHPADQAHLDAPARMVDPAAHEALIWGRHHFSKWNRGGLLKAREFFERAAAADACYAAAHAWVAASYMMLGYFHHLPREAAYARAKLAASTSLALDEELGEAHLTMGVIAFGDGDWTASEQAHRRALRMAPNSPWTHWGYAWLLTALGRHEQAIAAMLRALDLDPLNSYMRTSVGEMYWFAARPLEALEQYRRTLALDPGFSRAWDLIVMLYETQRLYPDALDARRERAAAAGHPDHAGGFVEAYSRDGEAGYLTHLLERLSAERGAVHNPRGAHEPPVPRPAVLAAVYSRLGETDRAIQLLESDFDPLIMTSPDYVPLYGNSRFEALLRARGLPSSAPCRSRAAAIYG